MSERRVRLRVRQVGPRPPLPQLSSSDPTQGDPSPTSDPDTAQEPTRLQRWLRWYRRSDLAKHTAVLAAAVAAASLAITAWGTYKAAQVADDQLTQSRENDENNERAQASRISIWFEGEQPTRIVLANRSLDPAWASVYLAPQAGPTVPEERIGVLSLLRIGVLPPCTRLNVPFAKLSEKRQQILDSRLGRLGLVFLDADGRTWARLAGGGLRELESQDSLEAAANDETTTWATEKDVEVKPLSECGQAAHPTQ